MVEDDEGVRSFVVSALKELGYEALEAKSAAAARETLAADPRITILITDVVMPGENGRSLVEGLRISHPDLIVLYMTGYTRNSVVHDGRLDPDVRLISKPFTLEDLSRHLRSAIGDKVSSDDFKELIE